MYQTTCAVTSGKNDFFYSGPAGLRQRGIFGILKLYFLDEKMKCELCHKAEAETAIRKELAGETRELYVCRPCAKKEALSHEAAGAAEAAPAAHADGPGALPALPLMGMILDAAFEIAGRAMSLAEPACPVCGILRNEYRKRSRLGCPACYEAFSKELDAAIFDLHRASRHVGKVPGKARNVRQREELEGRLGEAVKAQRYEEAIALRDQLRQLGGPDAEKKGGPA